MAELMEVLNEALRHHQEGRLQHAEELYRLVLQSDPQCAHAWNLLGVLAHQLNRNDIAAGYLQQAIKINPGDAAFYSNLAEIYRVIGRFDDAAACCRAALSLQPEHAGAMNNLGLALFGQGSLHEALPTYKRALELDPTLVEAHNNLGTILKQLNRPQEAIESYREAIRLRPTFAEAHNNLAGICKEMGDLESAKRHYQEALRFKPDFAEPHYNLGNIYSEQNQLAAAIECFQAALRLRPMLHEAHNNLAGAFKTIGAVDAALLNYREAIRIKPDFAQAFFNIGVIYDEQNLLEEARQNYLEAVRLCPELAEAHNNLGSLYLKLGRADWARESFAASVKHKPEHVGFASNILLCEQYLPDMSLAKMYRTHTAWAHTYAEPLRPAWPTHQNNRAPERRLRLGFVSADLGFHPVGCFFQPLLENLDQRQVEIYLYAAKKNIDFQAERLARSCNQWRQIHDLSEVDLAKLIEGDQIDILFDLSGHTAHHRLLTFARKPAPVQAGWIGYAGTTGFSAIDYMLADRFQIPQESEQYYTEKILRFPDAWICFEPPIDAPEVNALPAAQSGVVTFGSFNFLAKVTPKVVEVWAEILRRIPNSRIVLLYRGFDAESARSRFRELFTACGIEQDRVVLLGTHPHSEVMRQYHNVDIALDPFPYSGGLTTCESLWMGVPVVTCPSETFAGRHSYCLMSNVGLTDTIAGDHEQYIQVAVKLANDLPRLAGIRARLRQQMAHSPLCDAPRFARAFEALCRAMWCAWCKQETEHLSAEPVSA